MIWLLIAAAWGVLFLFVLALCSVGRSDDDEYY